MRLIVLKATSHQKLENQKRSRNNVPAMVDHEDVSFVCDSMPSSKKVIMRIRVISSPYFCF